MPQTTHLAGKSPIARQVPRVFSVSSLIPRANTPKSRSVRVVTEETTGATKLLSGVYWADPGSTGGWAFGATDPKLDGVPHIGIGEEVYLCLRGRLSVEWEGGTFEFGAGDIVYFPNDRWYRTRVIGDEQVQMFYVMAPPPTSMMSLGPPVTISGEPIEDTQGKEKKG
jgi:mannose-6-phosphate isomerase-like protein (cupin superfamily)